MNCPVRTEPSPDEGHNQNPPALAPELTTRRSMTSRRSGSSAGRGIDLMDGSHGVPEDDAGAADRKDGGSGEKGALVGGGVREVEGAKPARRKKSWMVWSRGGGGGCCSDGVCGPFLVQSARKVWYTLAKYVKFIGPGFMVAVAYIDPGAYFSRSRMIPFENLTPREN
jgi:metal iron transporter